MLILALELTAEVAVFALSLLYPGVGLGVALALGRHQFPDATAPVMAAAPIYLAASAIGIVVQRRWRGVDPESVVLALCIGAIVGVGVIHFPPTATGMASYANEKTFFLLVVVVPLLLLSGVFAEDDRIFRHFLCGLVAVPLFLALFAGAGAATPGERSGALGGGPIVLAQLCGIGVLIVYSFPSSLFPFVKRPLELLLRFLLGAVLVGVAIRTQSRFPVIALFVVILLDAFLRRRSRVGGKSAVHRLLKSRITLVVVILALFGVLAQEATGSSSRFALLQHPQKEIERSRAELWRIGAQEAAAAGLWGRGLGSFRDGHEGALIGDDRYAHNPVLEVLSEAGWLVGGFTLVVCGWFTTRVLRRAQVVERLLIFYALLMIQVSGDLYNSRYLFVFVAIGAARARLRARKRDERVALEKEPV